MPSSQIVTVAARKRLEARRRAAAASAIVEALRAYAMTNGGRFFVFGSFASGTMRHDSDLDVMLDVDLPQRQAAWDFLEALAARHNLELDLFDRSSTKAAFAARVAASGMPLP